jgi:hypothetical protein
VLRLRHEQVGRVGAVTRRCMTVTRPIGIVVGILMALLMIFIVLSFLLTSIDKLSPSAASYVLTHAAIFNPLDSLLYLCAPFFPLDYFVFAIIVAFMFFATVRERNFLFFGLLFSSFFSLLTCVCKNRFPESLAGVFAHCGLKCFPSNTNAPHRKACC